MEINLPTESKVVASSALTALMRRLEAATSRLEDIATTGNPEAPKSNGLVPSTIPAAFLTTTPTPAAPIPPKPAADPLPQSVADFDQFIALSVRKYVSLSDEIGGPVAEQVHISLVYQMYIC